MCKVLYHLTRERHGQPKSWKKSDEIHVITTRRLFNDVAVHKTPVIFAFCCFSSSSLLALAPFQRDHLPSTPTESLV